MNIKSASDLRLPGWRPPSSGEFALDDVRVDAPFLFAEEKLLLQEYLLRRCDSLYADVSKGRNYIATGKVDIGPFA